MYLMYVDASGDPGNYDLQPNESKPSRKYIVSSITVPAVHWNDTFQQFYQFRRYLKNQFGFPIRTELKGKWLASPKYADRDSHPHYKQLGNKASRMQMYETIMAHLPQIFKYSKIINIHVNKVNRTTMVDWSNYEEVSWDRLAQRYHTYLRKETNSSPGMIIADENDEPKVRGLLRRRRVHNPLPSTVQESGYYQAPITTLIEDPVFRRSDHSYFVQVADLISYALLMMLEKKMRKYNADRFFEYLDPILNKDASRKDLYGYGIVHV